MTLGPPDGFELRGAEPGDIDAIVEMSNAYNDRLGIPHEAIREYLTWVFAMTHLDLSRDTFVATHDGIVHAYAHAIFDPAEGGPIHAYGVVGPESWDRGLGRALLDWLDGMVAVRRAERVRIGVPIQDVRAHDLLADRGYEKVRLSWDMGRSLAGYRNDSAMPDGVTIRTFRVGQDERAYFDVSSTAFLDHWDHRPQSFESFSADVYDDVVWNPDLTYLAELDGQVAGEVLALRFEELGYIASVGVLRYARGRGVAKAMLGRAFADLAARGLDRVELSVDASSPTGAVDLYETVGMSVIRESPTFFGPAA